MPFPTNYSVYDDISPCVEDPEEITISRSRHGSGGITMVGGQLIFTDADAGSISLSALKNGGFINRPLCNEVLIAADSLLACGSSLAAAEALISLTENILEGVHIKYADEIELKEE